MNYEPQEQCLPFHQSREIVREIIGDNRSGKSVAAAADLAWMLLNQHPHRRPVNVAKVASFSFEGIRRVCWPLLRQFLEEHIDHHETVWWDKSEGIPTTVLLKGGVFIKFYSVQHLDKGVFAPKATWWFDECDSLLLQNVLNEIRDPTNVIISNSTRRPTFVLRAADNPYLKENQ